MGNLPTSINCYNKYDTYTLDNAIKFIPSISIGKVVRVYDGDTITIVTKIKRNKNLYKFQVRLRGIDCPEMRSKDENEKEIAHIAKKTVSQQILHKIVYLDNIDYDKYGRILADVYLDKYKQHKLQDLLICWRLAVVYDGGTKQPPTNWKQYNQFISS